MMAAMEIVLAASIAGFALSGLVVWGDVTWRRYYAHRVMVAAVQRRRAMTEFDRGIWKMGRAILNVRMTIIDALTPALLEAADAMREFGKAWEASK